MVSGGSLPVAISSIHEPYGKHGIAFDMNCIFSFISEHCCIAEVC